MFRIFIKSTFRNLLKDKYQSGLNILGLTFGFAAFLFIATYFFYEKSFDKFHSKSGQIYRVVTKIKMGDTKEILSNSESPLAFTVKEEIPEVLDATRIFYRNNVVVRIGDDKYLERRFWYADDNVFQLFDFNLLEGNKEQVLTKPNTVVLTETFVEKYFGGTNPIGKTIKLNEGEVYEVTGILEDLPSTSHLQFGMLASFSSMDFSDDYAIHRWGTFRDMYTFLLLKENTDIELTNKKLQEATIKYYEPMMEANGMSLNDFEKAGNFVKHSLQPLEDIHLNTTFTQVAVHHGNKQLINALALIGILIIIIASFNFINLSTARSVLRAKEIGVKKIIGSGKRKIIAQLLFETFIQALIALILAILLLGSILSILNIYTGLSLQFVQFFTSAGIFTILGVLCIVVALTGVLPSITIARFNPVDVIKGTMFKNNSKYGLRSVLVSFQFVVFILLISSTIVVRKQVSLLHNQNPGFLKENVLVVKNANKLNSNQKTFKEELLKNPSAISASYSTNLPSMFNNASNPFSKPDKKNQIFLNRVKCDKDFIKTLNISLLNGREFTADGNRERGNAIINQKAAEAFGWTDCKDKIIYDFNNGGANFNVIGIVENFHIESLREEIEPMIIRYQETGDFLSVRIRPESAVNMVETVSSLWSELNKQAPFEYVFLDESFDNQYKKEAQFGKLISLFSILSIIIACLGLLGLVSFTLTRKNKEIGVRKVNGAKISEVLAMLNKDFIKWVLLAFVIATPVAYYAMNKWLENFAYKTTLSWWIFALAGVLALGIALLTVSWQSWKAASRNPIESLRYE